ncbi:hypothetical protein LRP52_43115 [Photobacterium sp. ZSDE20]|uniref:Uncharacterized protein n=1 Tax=Photobacterium pectinilyticum TaxID=2906793 RepID=A0ABT1N4E4_9GAMM|nr:hypothetical protein [Photobacterium sp. ZSDE20]MCQ1059602.1 hypothetical protein [Photobacterium sp. ZSDE20]MDD1828963.1 hypothetical protein [Photobacterium sp. ZSDE20]
MAEEKLSALPDQLKNDLEITGTDLGTYLREAFGIDSASKEVKWTLESGRKAKFIEASLSYEQVKNDTVVEFEINGRDQDFLNEENLSDLSIMDYQQFYPAIACRKEVRLTSLTVRAAEATSLQKMVLLRSLLFLSLKKRLNLQMLKLWPSLYSLLKNIISMRLASVVSYTKSQA